MSLRAAGLSYGGARGSLAPGSFRPERPARDGWASTIGQFYALERAAFTDGDLPSGVGAVEFGHADVDQYGSG